MFIKSNKGLTLIETIIYLALFKIIIGGAILAAYQLIESSNRTKTMVILGQEANFILRKINWAMTGVNSSSFSVSPSGEELRIQHPSGLIVFSFNQAESTLKKDGLPLNNSLVKISKLSFKRITSADALDGVRVTFTVSNLDGTINREFSLEKYVKF